MYRNEIQCLMSVFSWLVTIKKSAIFFNRYYFAWGAGGVCGGGGVVWQEAVVPIERAVPLH